MSASHEFPSSLTFFGSFPENLSVKLFEPLRLVVLILVSICVFLQAASAAPLRQQNVRVALHKGVETVRLDGEGVLATDESGIPLRIVLPLQVKRSRENIAVGGVTVRKLVAASPAVMAVNGKKYRGTIEITPYDKGLLVVNELPLEDYLVGLINCEISSQWPIDAVKAQAVVARTYAVYQRNARADASYHLESSVLDQVYDGCDIEDSRAARGVRETEGEILAYGGQPIQAFYHSNCGGRTELAENVWGYRLPYLQSVECAYCSGNASSRWEQTIPLKKLESLLKVGGVPVSGLRDIREGKRNESGRLVNLLLIGSRGTTTVTAVNFRKSVGYTVIKSTNFSVAVSDDGAQFAGAGYGHGVGLCQWGAKQRAADGFTYREILAYYYPGARLERLYGGQGDRAD